MKMKLWIVPAGSEFIGRTSEGEMLAATPDGVEPALDLSDFVSDIHLAGPEPLP